MCGDACEQSDWRNHRPWYNVHRERIECGEKIRWIQDVVNLYIIRYGYRSIIRYATHMAMIIDDHKGKGVQ